ncbi:NfeD family protein [Adonisia turfae]|nr:NfeD family protein [Adonisia turfae]
MKNFTEGIVDEVLKPYQEWRVKVHGVYWHACSQVNFNFSPGDHIQVVGRNNLKLVIAPM